MNKCTRELRITTKVAARARRRFLEAAGVLGGGESVKPNLGYKKNNSLRA